MANRFQTLADKYHPKLRKALIKAFNNARSSVKQKAIIKALEKGGPEAVMSLLDDLGGMINSQISDVLDDAIRAGGALPMVALGGAVLDKNFTFDMFNPGTVEFLRRYKLGLIKDLTVNTLNAIRNALIKDIIAGKNPRDTARKFRNTIGLTVKQEQAITNYQAMLESLDKDVLRRALRDKRFDATILRAIESGNPLSKAQIEKMVNRYRERFIKHRAETIARTEALRAVTIGNRQGIMQMISSGAIDYQRIRKFWKPIPGPRTRDAHRRVPSLNPDGRMLDEPYVTPLGPMMYPRDPNGIAANTINCRCYEAYKILDEGEV